MSNAPPTPFDTIPDLTEATTDPLDRALAREPVLRDLPSVLRDPIKDALKTLDETLLAHAIDALDTDAEAKPAITTAAIALLKLLKGEGPAYPIPSPFEMPPSVAPPNPVAPGETLLTLPPIKF
ncbi:hypothetical protein LVJ94_52305 [Pendulispora rubella]|uniref:Uncharacterized protein n=1 Tax=Pendulispora rubella TaxID=2741070 RepID=A0ABZ2L3E2_9BACT